MISLLFIIFGHIAYGTTNTLWYNPRNTIGTLPLIMVRSFSCFLIFFASHYILLKFEIIPSKQFNNCDITAAIKICIINYFGLFFFLLSLKHAKITNTIGFSKVGLIFGVLIGHFVYHEEISILKTTSCVLIFIGISLIEKSINKKTEPISKGLIYTFLSRLFWATGFLFIPYINKLGVLLFCSVLEGVVFVMSLILYIISKKEAIQNVNSKIKKEIIILILLGSIGTFCFNFAIITTKSIIIFAFLGLIEPIVGLIISKLYHHEELNKLQLVGVLIGILASIILSIT